MCAARIPALFFILYSFLFERKVVVVLGKQIKAGEKLPFFKYDTPYSAANSFRQLLAEHAPLVLVFMSNFGHPITRTFVGRYAATYDELTGGSLALVVRSRADRLARSVGPDTLPYPLLCDADGVLYVTEGIADDFTSDHETNIIRKDGDT